MGRHLPTVTATGIRPPAAASQQAAAFFSECEEMVAEQFVIVALAYQSAFLESRGETVGDLGDCPARHRIGKEIAVAADLIHDLAHLGRDGIRRAVELDRLDIGEASHLPQRTSRLDESVHGALVAVDTAEEILGQWLVEVEFRPVETLI